MVRARLIAAPLAVAAVVVAALVAGDGGGPTTAGDTGDPSPSASSSPPREVTAEEFCDGFGRLAQAQQAQQSAPSPAAVEGLRTAAAEVRDLAAGTTMPAEARAGVDFIASAFEDLPDDATADDVVRSDDDATIRDDANAQALAAYIGENCGPPPAPAPAPPPAPAP